MLDSTKAIEFAYQCGHKVYTEVKICLNFADITSRIVLLFCITSFRVKSTINHYFGYRNYIYFPCTLTAHHLGKY